MRYIAKLILKVVAFVRKTASMLTALLVAAYDDAMKN